MCIDDGGRFFQKASRSHRKFFWADIHRLFGLWSLWLVLVISITGIWYLVESLELKANYPERGKVLSQHIQQDQRNHDEVTMPSLAVI
ncbi:MAG: PepSY domain-containing protein [Colwellia sp.]|uniref:PepSY domain-containing protein n=1 Tax=Colwellia sp. TaxID=56799 RepID=UPI0025BC7F82|nr:PepSY-associated TM helix domain-containing protein [Colwellia sp.]NQZ27074.1 PepSY domain-containing protein [Colwellia sp.]